MFVSLYQFNAISKIFDMISQQSSQISHCTLSITAIFCLGKSPIPDMFNSRHHTIHLFLEYHKNCYHLSTTPCTISNERNIRF